MKITWTKRFPVIIIHRVRCCCCCFGAHNWFRLNRIRVRLKYWPPVAKHPVYRQHRYTTHTCTSVIDDENKIWTKKNRTDGQNPLRWWWKHCGKVFDIQLSTLSSSAEILYVSPIVFHAFDVQWKRFIFQTTIDCCCHSCCCYFVIMDALQLTQFRVKLHKLWSFQSVVFTNCRAHDTLVIFCCNNFALTFQKIARFPAITMANTKSCASEAYGMVILSTAIN